MAKVIVSKSKLDSIADAVASVSGAQTPLTLDDVVTEVGGLTKVEGTITINVNGSIDVTQYAEADVSVPTHTPSLQDKTVAITPTTSAQAQTVTADSGYDGLDEVTINTAAVPTGSAKPPTTISGSGATVTPGTNTIALSKTVNVTPRVTEGYISQGTQDSVLVYLNANVPTRDSSSMQVSGSTVTAPSGYYSADASVNVAFPPSVDVEPLSVTDNGTYTAPSGKAYSPVTVNVSGGGGITADEIATGTISGVMTGSKTYIGSYAFYTCKDITGVSFPNASMVGMYAFYKCESLADVQLKSTGGTANIQSFAFWGCRGLPKLSFPTVSSIGSSAFQICSGASFADFPVVTRIESRAFMSCYKLASISFPQATIIGDYVFAACSSLAEANLPSAKSLGYSVFMSCGNLSKVTLPVVSVIGGACFSRCFKLTELHLEGVPSVPKLSASTAFFSTPIGGYTGSTGGVYGSVFVPASLYAAFCASQYWSLISSRIVSV